MSTAELKAYNIYHNYNLSSLNQEERQCLVVLLGGIPSSSSHHDEEETMPMFTIDELRLQARQNTEDIKNGNCHPIGELFEELGKEYPWAFK